MRSPASHDVDLSYNRRLMRTACAVILGLFSLAMLARADAQVVRPALPPTPAATPSVAGNWTGTWEATQGSGGPYTIPLVMTLTQAGSAVSGTWTTVRANGIVSGTITASTFSGTFTWNAPAINSTCTGTFAAAGTAGGNTLAWTSPGVTSGNCTNLATGITLTVRLAAPGAPASDGQGGPRPFVGAGARPGIGPGSGRATGSGVDQLAAQDTARAEAQSKGLATMRRLPPSAFPNVPVAVRQQMEARGCQIPQPGQDVGPQRPEQPVNVIRGDFAGNGSVDWAALCENNDQASVVVFWGKPNACPSELATSANRDSLEGFQSSSASGWEYVRTLAPKPGKDLVEDLRHANQQQAGGGTWVSAPPPEYPSLSHAGIADIRSSHGFDFLYCSHGTWYTLPYGFE
jgi:hypothetical protein